MTIQETIQLLEALKSAGVSHYKHGDMDISFGSIDRQIETHLKAEQVPIDAPIAASEEIKHEVHELTSILKLSDTDLLERLFPDHLKEELSEEVVQ